MKTYLFTDANREEVLRLLRTRSYTGVRNYLQQLPEAKSQSKITSQSQSSNPEEAGHNNGAKETSKNSSANKDNEPREKQNKPATPSHTSKEKGGLKI